MFRSPLADAELEGTDGEMESLSSNLELLRLLGLARQMPSTGCAQRGIPLYNRLQQRYRAQQRAISIMRCIEEDEPRRGRQTLRVCPTGSARTRLIEPFSADVASYGTVWVSNLESSETDLVKECGGLDEEQRSRGERAAMEQC